jgi:hypothetical protein
MIRRQRYGFQDPTNGTGPAKHGVHGWFAAAISIGTTAASVGAQLYSGSQAAGAAGAAAGLQKEYIDLGIKELRGALGPSMERLDKEQAWSDTTLKNFMRGGMRELEPYRQAGAGGLKRLNYLTGLDTGVGPEPAAPTAPKKPVALKPPVYSKDPKQAAAQKAQYQAAVAVQNKKYKQDLRAFEQAKAKYPSDLSAWQAASAAAASDPNYGSMMKPYEDKYEGRIDEVAKRQYVDKYAPEILDVSRDKFDAGDFEADPGYQFRRSEGGRGVEQGASARGALLSGAALKELDRFNQDTASNEFDRAHGRWADVRNTRLGALTGQQRFDYGTWGDQKNTELGSLVDRRNFDFGNFDNNRKFQYGALTGMVDTGQEAVDDRNRLREYFGGQRTQNRLNTAVQLGNWRNHNAEAIAEFLAQSGNAQAAGQVGAANAWGNAFQGAGNALGTLAGYYGNGRRRQGLVHRTPPA